MPTELTIGPRTYKVGRLNAFDQLAVVRAFGSVMTVFVTAATDPVSKDGRDATSALISMGLAQLSDAENDRVLDLTLKVVEFKNANGTWSALRAPDGQLMQPIELPELLKLVNAVVAGNLAGFFDEVRARPPDGAGAVPAT